MIRVFSVLFFVFAAGLSGAAEPSAVGSVRQTIAEWVETQRILSEEKAAWREQEEALRQSIGLLETEVSRLNEGLTELAASGDETEDRRRILAEERERLETAALEANEWLAGMEEQLRELRPSFPLPLETRAAPLFANLQGVGEGKSVDVGQRLQTVLGLLAEVNSFQKNVTLSRETRELGDGTRREVRTIYLGLAQAFFVDDQERLSGFGRPGASGWEWTRDDAIAADVARAVAVLEGRRPAEFINLPISTQ